MEALNEEEIDDSFPEEGLFNIDQVCETKTPWFANLAAGFLPRWMFFQQNRKFHSDVKYYLWEDPYLFKLCVDHMIPRCISHEEWWKIWQIIILDRQELITKTIKLLKRCLNQVFIGHPYSMMLKGMLAVSKYVTFLSMVKCLIILYWCARYLMCGLLISRVHLLFCLGTSTS